MSKNTEPGFPQPDAVLDVSGHECPIPATRARRHLDAMVPGQVLKIIATDPLAVVDLQILSDRCGHAVLGSRESAGMVTVWIRVSPGRRPSAG